MCWWKETSKDNHDKLFKFEGKGHKSEMQARDSNHPQLTHRAKGGGVSLS